MKLIKSVLFTTVFLPLLFIFGCAATQDPADAYKGETPQYIFAQGKTAMRDRNYQEAIKRFEALEVQYPFGKDTEMASLYIIYAYYKTSDYVSSEASADLFLQAHPTSAHADYAYFIRGLADYYQNLGIFERFFAVDLAERDLAHIKKAYDNFATLVKLYPASLYAPAARQYMIYLRNVLADHELQVAQYYFDHAAYVAAANRASLVVRHYDGSPAVVQALVIMAKSYRALHLKQNEEDVVAVLQANFPNVHL